jgi:hypothetical protein
VHTARIDLLLSIFPRARFVYAHRHPLEVFQSAEHMARSYYPYCFLQTPSSAHILDFILCQYDILFAVRPLFPRHTHTLPTACLCRRRRRRPKSRIPPTPAPPPPTQTQPKPQEYMRQRGSVPRGRLVEVAFAELDAAPLAAIGRVYRELGLSGFEEHVAPCIERYAATLTDFRKNRFGALPPALEAAVRARWAASFAAHGYS